MRAASLLEMLSVRAFRLRLADMTFRRERRNADQRRYMARKRAKLRGEIVPEALVGRPPRPFEACFQKTETCWLWTGAKTTKDGYGVRYTKFGRRQAHRVAWELYRGPIPEGMLVLHHCDVRLCVNPAHLFIGTNDDNMADMVAKCRSPLGERNSSSKHTREVVTALIESYTAGGNRALRRRARELNVGVSTAYGIAKGERWRHIPRPTNV